jgi:hypothetical protein
LTITLPSFGKDFQKSLDLKSADRRLFAGFQRKGGLPRFLGGFLDRVFDRDSGRLLDEPDVDAILAIRQLTLMFGKIEIPCSDARISQAMSDFVQCEQDVRSADARRTPMQIEDFRRMSALLFAKVFTKLDHEIYHHYTFPQHGPGATADKLMGNQKFEQKLWTERLDRIFPVGEYLLPNWRYYDQLEGIDILEPGAEIPVRVVSVPKTLKAPRIIAIEPTAMQYAQQSLRVPLSESILRHDYLGRIIGLDDQVPNQELAAEGSRYGNLATLDLSEASDRVSNQLVRTMLSNWPHLHEAVDACRSRKAEVPGHGVIRLAKFASMGSALTFPIEAMVFTTLIFLGIEQGLNRPLCQRDVKHLAGRVRVFGDDIIVPVDYVRPVIQSLESFGIKVNLAKSFWTGKFRESCGGDYYDGHDISIVRVRNKFPTSLQDATGVQSLVSLRNQLYFAGYWATCSWLDGKIKKMLKHFPVVLPSSPVLGRHSFLGYSTEREHKHLHSPLVKGWSVTSTIPKNSLDGSGALLKFFLKRGGLPSVDKKHLERSGRPYAVDIKLGWTSPF